MELRESQGDYLETIYLMQKEGVPVRNSTIAKRMGFAKPSVTIALRLLTEYKLITTNELGRPVLTEEGYRRAEEIWRRHQFFKNLLIQAGVPGEDAERDACHMEHAISEENFQKLRAFVGAKLPEMG